jgi:hypothetical protein
MPAMIHRLLLAGAALLALPHPAAAQTNAAQPCRVAIHTAERAAALPPHLMAAIARVESGRRDAAGAVHPWPWTINAEGTGQYFETKDAAIAAVRALQSRGVRSIDVGCMQVNLAHHPAAFATLDQAFDPAANAAYAARFLTTLYAETRDWTRATAFYHSQTPDRGEAYQRRVAAAIPHEQRLAPQPGHVFSRHVFSNNAFTATSGPRTGPLARSGLPHSGLPIVRVRM